MTKQKLKRGELRSDENGVPLLVVESQLKIFVHSHIDVMNEDGDVETMKMAATKPFLRAFNSRVFDMLQVAIEKAHDSGRTRLLERDLANGEEREE